jgi:hypothetical protein
MNGSILVLLLIVLVAFALVGQCDVRRAAGQTPHVMLTRQPHACADPSSPPGDGSAPVHSAGPLNSKEGDHDHGLETDPVPGRRRDGQHCPG